MPQLPPVSVHTVKTTEPTNGPMTGDRGRLLPQCSPTAIAEQPYKQTVSATLLAPLRIGSTVHNSSAHRDDQTSVPNRRTKADIIL